MMRRFVWWTTTQSTSDEESPASEQAALSVSAPFCEAKRNNSRPRTETASTPRGFGWPSQRLPNTRDGGAFRSQTRPSHESVFKM
jgi:hypothetical protein